MNTKKTLTLGLGIALMGGSVANAGLYALYQFEDASGAIGATIVDSSDAGNNGTVTSAAIGLVASTAGHGNAGDFNGDAGRVIASSIVQSDGSSPVSLTVNDFTVAFWINVETLVQPDSYVTTRNQSGKNQIASLYGYADDVEFSNLVTSHDGTKLHSGIAVSAIGSFNVPEASITDFSTFQQLGLPISFYQQSTSTDGLFSRTLNVDPVASGFDGKDVYIVIGNNPADITQSTSWLVYKTGQQFSSTGPTSITLAQGSGSLIKGEIGKYNFTNPEPGSPRVEAYNLVNIPEPSSATLLVLGGLALILRRRKG